MKQFKKIIVVSLVFIFMVSFLYSTAMGQSHEKPPGEDPPPPLGVAHQSDAQGIKLNGWICIEFYDYEPNSDIAGGARVIVRLRKGSDLETFFKTVPGPLDVCLITGPQEAIFNAFGPGVIHHFFGADYCYAGSEICTPDKTELGIKLKEINNLSKLVDNNNIIIRDDPDKVGMECSADGPGYRTELDENCVNYVDDDGDGLVDRDDPSCKKMVFWFIADIEVVVK